jgi:tripartite-type tricarboxylate transporter receptor subunit TctC
MRLVGRCFLFVAVVAASAGVCIVLASDRDARAQIAKTVKIVVPYAPGGAADIVARLVAEQVGRSGGPAIVVENRPGAGGAVGTETVARAVPDGNTALVVSIRCCER